LTWLDLTWLDLTWLDLTWLDLTWLDLTWLDLTWLHMTWLDLTWLDFTCLKVATPDFTWLQPEFTWLHLTSFDFNWLSEGPRLVGYQRLLIQHRRNYPPYLRTLLHPQTEDAPCRGDTLSGKQFGNKPFRGLDVWEKEPDGSWPAIWVIANNSTTAIL